MVYWLVRIWSIRSRIHRCETRVVTDRGLIVDAGPGLERFIGGKWEAMWRELEKAGWQME